MTGLPEGLARRARDRPPPDGRRHQHRRRSSPSGSRTTATTCGCCTPTPSPCGSRPGPGCPGPWTGRRCPRTTPWWCSRSWTTATSCIPRCARWTPSPARRSRSSGTRAWSWPASASRPSRATCAWPSRTSASASAAPPCGTRARASSPDLPVDLPGAVEPVGLVAGRRRAAAARAARRVVTSSTGTTSRPASSTRLETEPGSITAAAVRPDGSVWYRGHNGVHPARLLEVGSDVPLLEADGPAAPAGRPFEAWWFENPHGQQRPRLPGPPRRRGPAPGDHARPRRPALRGHGPLGAGRPGPRGRRVPGRDGQLPRLGGVRAGVARRAHRQHRLPGARGRHRRPGRHRGARASRTRRGSCWRAGPGAATSPCSARGGTRTAGPR